MFRDKAYLCFWMMVRTLVISPVVASKFKYLKSSYVIPFKPDTKTPSNPTKQPLSPKLPSKPHLHQKYPKLLFHLLQGIGPSWKHALCNLVRIWMKKGWQGGCLDKVRELWGGEEGREGGKEGIGEMEGFWNCAIFGSYGFGRFLLRRVLFELIVAYWTSFIHSLFLL